MWPATWSPSSWRSTRRSRASSCQTRARWAARAACMLGVTVWVWIGSAAVKAPAPPLPPCLPRRLAPAAAGVGGGAEAGGGAGHAVALGGRDPGGGAHPAVRQPGVPHLVAPDDTAGAAGGCVAGVCVVCWVVGGEGISWHSNCTKDGRRSTHPARSWWRACCRRGCRRRQGSWPATLQTALATPRA